MQAFHIYYFSDSSNNFNNWGQFRGSCIFEDANIVISNLSAHRPHQKHKDPAGFATCGVFFWS